MEPSSVDDSLPEPPDLSSVPEDEELVVEQKVLKPQKITATLIASSNLEKEALQLDADALSDRLMDLKRLRLDRLRIDSMDGLDLCSEKCTHLMMQHNWLTEIDGLQFFDKLQYLVLSHNRLTIIDGVSHLRSLQYLDASHNEIARVPRPSSQLPCDSLMALELNGNPCAEIDGYRAQLISGLPKLLYLDEVRITNTDRGLESEDDGEEGEEDGEEEYEEEEEEEAASPAPIGGQRLEGARAQVEAQLAQVDALLMQSGYDINAAEEQQQSGGLPASPSAARVQAQVEELEVQLSQTLEPKAAENTAVPGDGSDGEPLDPVALYSKALEMYGVNADVQATQDKISAIKGRMQERRREFAALQEMGAPAFRSK